MRQDVQTFIRSIGKKMYIHSFGKYTRGIEKEDSTVMTVVGIRRGWTDKRLEIDLDVLRENLWFTADDELKDNLSLETDRNRPRWIDTSTMIADPLTKDGNDKFYSRLEETMVSGWISFTPTPESELKKLKQQKARREKALGRTTSEDLE